MPRQITEINFKGQNFYSGINIKNSFAVEAGSLVKILLTWPGYYGKIFLLLLLQTAKEKKSQD